MASLATIGQLEDRFGDITNVVRAQALLDDASASVRSYTGQDFARVARTLNVWSPGCFRLSGVNVATVTATYSGTAVILTRLGRDEWSSAVVASPTSGIPLVVTYTSGWATIPEDIVAVVCSMAARALALDPSMAAVQQETTGPFSVSVGAAAAQGGIGMLAGERAILDRYQVRTGAIRMRSWADATDSDRAWVV